MEKAKGVGQKGGGLEWVKTSASKAAHKGDLESLSLGIYTFIAICSFSCLVWRTRISYVLAVAAAPIEAGFALLTLVTGSICGKPIWGTWWVWDARLTSMLVLFFYGHCYHNQLAWLA